MDNNNKASKAHNLALVSKASTQADPEASSPDHYYQAIAFAKDLLAERNLGALMQRIFSAASSLLAISGMRFTSNGELLEFGESAIHSMSFTMANPEREFGELIFYHRKRLIPHNASVEILENLLALVLPALITCLEHAAENKQSTAKEKLCERLTMALSRPRCNESLILVGLNNGSDGVSKNAAGLIKRIVQLSSRKYCFFSATIHSGVIAVMLPGDKAEFIAERIRLLIASDAQTLDTLDTLDTIEADKLSVSAIISITKLSAKNNPANQEELAEHRSAEAFLNAALQKLNPNLPKFNVEAELALDH